MKALFSLTTIIIALLISGCKEEVKVVPKPEVKIDSSKLTPSITMLNRDFSISYSYQGREGLTKIQRKIEIKLTPISYDTSGATVSNLKLKVKNTGFELFIIVGEDLFLMKNEELLGNLANYFYRIEIQPGKEQEFTISIPKSLASGANLIDVRKRSAEGLISAFQIKLR
ncbi:MAG: hypothetical protein LCH52_16465 [Bacteroidetes bacterium]|nr:hypothetical protein [Bacteroidota bacterium]